MARVQMLDQYVRHLCPRTYRLEQLCECLQATGRGTDTDNRERGPSGRLTLWTLMDGAGFRLGQFSRTHFGAPGEDLLSKKMRIMSYEARKRSSVFNESIGAVPAVKLFWLLSSGRLPEAE